MRRSREKGIEEQQAESGLECYYYVYPTETYSYSIRNTHK